MGFGSEISTEKYYSRMLNILIIIKLQLDDLHVINALINPKKGH